MQLTRVLVNEKTVRIEKFEQLIKASFRFQNPKGKARNYLAIIYDRPQRRRKRRRL